jgi:hypothetical protein
MKNIESITLAIKQEIINHLVNSYCVYKGFNKRICKFKEFWHGQIIFPESFNLSTIPTIGTDEVTVGFDALVQFDMDGNVKEQSYISGQFGPVLISYSNKEYNLDFSRSVLSRLTS